MTTRKRQLDGFSLIEVLLAMATLTIGMVFVGGTFFVGVHYSTRSSEQGMGAVVAQEALNMIRLYGVNINDPNLVEGKVVDYQTVAMTSLKPEAFVYQHNPQYRWDALCQRVSDTSNLIGVTVLVSRWIGDAGNPPQLRSQDVTVVDDRFLEPDQDVILAHRQQVVDSNEHRLIYEVVRSQGDADNGVRWELVPEPTLSDTNDLTVWAVLPDVDEAFGTQSRTVFVLRDEIRF